MQRNFTPQGKPQDPSALDRQMHASALGELRALASGLASRTMCLADLNQSVTKALRLGGHTTGELHAMLRDARLALGLKA